MKDNFDIHSWNLKRYLNEAEVEDSKMKEDLEKELEIQLEKEFPSLNLYASMYGSNSGRVTFRRKGDIAMDIFNEVISFIEKQGFKVDRSQSDNEFDSDDDRYWYPRIEFKKSDITKNF
jgi:hypothetical protein